MKVKCINTGYDVRQSELTLNKEYELISSTKSYYFIINDEGNKLAYLKERFEVVEDEVNQEPINERYVRLFPSGAIRSDNRGRERYDFISPLALKELAQFLATTENSFVQTNYFKGIPEEACVESLLRHLNEYQLTGNKKDAVGALFNCLALVHTIALKERGEYVEYRKETIYMPESEYKEKLKKGEV